MTVQFNFFQPKKYFIKIEKDIFIMCESYYENVSQPAMLSWSQSR